MKFSSFIPYTFSLLGILFLWGVISTFAEALSGEEKKIVSGEVTGTIAPRTIKQTRKLESEASFFFAQRDRLSLSVRPRWEDADISRFVTKKIPLSDIEYEPNDLVSISGSSIDQAGRNSLLRREARDALLGLAKSFEKEFGKPLVVISGYRSAKYQKRLWDLGRCTDTLCAPPGYSEHQLGLAVDIFDASNEDSYMANMLYRKYVSWVQAHAHLYGYTQSYQNGPTKDSYDIEPWHWRYLGVTLASKLHDLDMTYSEYIEFESMLDLWWRR